MWLSWLGVILQTERSWVWFLVRAHAWVAGSVPVWVCAKGNWLMFLSHISISLPLFRPPFPSYWNQQAGLGVRIKTKTKKRTSGQYGGIGRYTLPPHTTKSRTTTNLKTKNNQNCQKMELYGSPTTKELKKKHSPRPVGGEETGSQDGQDSQKSRGWQTGQGGNWRSGQSHICVQINQEEQLGRETVCTTQGSRAGKWNL